MYQNKREHYFNRIEAKSLSLFFSGKSKEKSADQHFPFCVNRNFYYLSGIHVENAALLLAKSETKTESYLFIEVVDPIKALWDGEGLSFEKASEISGVDVKNIKNINDLDQFITELLSTTRRALFGFIDTFYMDLERLSHLSVDTFAITYSKKLQNLFPSLTIKTNQMILAELRMSKTKDEVENIQKAIDITKEGLDNIMKSLEPKKFEYQIEAEFNYALNLNRSTPAFNTIIASGKNATVLHYTNNDQKLNDHELILCDLGATFENYNADITRTYPINGTFTPRQKEIYEVVLEANKKTIEALKVGMTLKEFNDVAKSILISGAKRLGLIKEDDEITKYYYHGVGHYLGLDVHDVGNYSLPIVEGSVITVEPGLYIAEEKIGIRIEDDIYVTKDGPINLSKSIIKEVLDIEKFMKK
jgi:Xaa-Pro aminopeptidase